MAMQRKIIVSGDHIEPDTGPTWTVLWDTTTRSAGEWSTAGARNEASALERAAHFLKLGFLVHAIKDPSGAVVLDAAAVTGRLVPATAEPPRPSPEPPSAEEPGRQLLRAFIEGYGATPGRMLAATSLSALLSEQGMSPSEFERAVTYATRHNWLTIADGTLTLTRLGYEIEIHRQRRLSRVSGAPEAS